MSKFLRNKGFKAGFTLGIILFLLAQVGSFFKQLFLLIYRDFNTSPNISVHGFWDIGFPFSMYYGMFDFFQGKVNLSGLVGNILFGLVLSLLIGIIFQVYARFTARN